MNIFFDVSEARELPNESLQLYNLGKSKVFASFGKTTRDGWGSRSTEWNHISTDINSEDYDEQFVRKLLKWEPLYDIGKVIDHHYSSYSVNRNILSKIFLIICGM